MRTNAPSILEHRTHPGGFERAPRRCWNADFGGAKRAAPTCTEKGKSLRGAVVAAVCKKDGISLTELRSGSRRGKLPALTVKIVQNLVKDYGVPIADLACQVGISTSGVSKILTRSLSSYSTASLHGTGTISTHKQKCCRMQTHGEGDHEREMYEKCRFHTGDIAA